MKKPTVLLIDDEQDFLLLMTKKITSEGYRVIGAVDGEDGIAKARAHKPDLVMCDLKMPKKDGFAVLKELRQKRNFRGPFIILTNLDDFDKVKKAYECKADFYVSKTVSPDKLMRKVRMLLNISKNRI